MLKSLLPLFTRILTVTLLLIYEGILTPTQTLLLHADSVVVVRDNEATEKKQAETDAAHDRQIARIRELRGTCADWRPPVGVKDVAELNGRERAGVEGPRHSK